MFFRNLLKGVALTAALSLPLMCAEQRKHNVYMWGNGVYQARPDALLQFHNFAPKRITNLPDNLVSLTFGQYYEAGIDSKGSLWIWRTHQVDANEDTNNGNSDYQRKQVQQLAQDVLQVKFTKGYIWTLTKKGRVIQYPIVKEVVEGEVRGTKLGKEREVEPLRGSSQIATGADHVMALKAGEVWTMGDDTYGQCGIESEKRTTFPPFNESRVSYPIKAHLKGIKKIAAGGHHCLALDEGGSLFGWGSNSAMQLSHEQEFSRMNTPLIASFSPIKISQGLDSCQIMDIAGGSQFSVVVGRNRQSDAYEVYTFGSNLSGQLGQGQIRHLRDVTRVEGLSNFVLKRKGKQQKVIATQVACGLSHTIVLLNIGYVMQWGDNEFGQMGNRKRSPVYSPIIVREFNNQDIVGVFAGENNSGVIVKQQQQAKASVKGENNKQKE